MKKLTALSFLISLLTLMSCNAIDDDSEINTVDYVLENGYDLSLYCVLNESGKQELSVSRRTDGGTFKSVGEATAVLSIKVGETWQKVGSFRKEGNIMVLNYTPQYDADYKLEVSANSLTAVCYTRMPGKMKSCFWPNPVLMVSPYLVENCIFPSRYIGRADMKESDLNIAIWFTENGVVVGHPYTNNSGASAVNALKEGVSYRYVAVPDGVKLNYDGKKAPLYIPSSNQEAGKWVECFFPYHERSVFIRNEEGQLHSYMVPSATISMSSTNYDLDKIFSILSTHPEYGCVVSNNTFVGPAFDVWPGQGIDADLLHIDFYSDELFEFLASKKPTEENQAANIQGASGVFGATVQIEEDYSNYLTRLSDFYKELGNN